MGRLAIAVLAVGVIGAATALAVAVAGSRDTAAATSLTVTYWPTGPSGNIVKWTLRCAPVGGTLRAPAKACAKLRAGGAELFAPLPRDFACTDIWSGPQVARVTGKLWTRTVNATFNRANGCQIDRWNKLSPWLLPRGGVT